MEERMVRGENDRKVKRKSVTEIETDKGRKNKEKKRQKAR
jgi:hypothetical protein